nr:sulfatase/phosphatase domain-containing protein [Aestuariibaculum suncheonense]
MLDLANIENSKAKDLEGLSLKSALENKILKDRPVFWHYQHYSGGLGGTPSGAVRLGDFKLIEFYEDMSVELYNIKKDISESQNLAKINPEKVEELKTLLHEWRKNVNAKMPYPNPYYSTPN